MNNTIKEQLNMLKTLEFQVDGKPSKEFPEFFNEVVFMKNNAGVEVTDTREKQIIFKDYIIHPFEGFDFHDKFNNGVAPPERVMYGCILKETEKMYYLKVRTADYSKIWEGFCPKKSMEIS